ncbi:MAG: hypothetical protein KatS3mg115_0104 [Candidatus Poribacteria bacterium]|nr:MAG: hypothetical protein KatS3mg115_0104 [Candidatus Poribacteria bacterium]
MVDVDEIYNEFGYGLATPFAIRNFLRYALNVWAAPPEFVLLVGDAHYDYKNAETRYYQEFGINKVNYPNFVPTFHSWSPEWGETPMDIKFAAVLGDDPIPDLAIGRLPIQRPGELDEYVEKLIAYESNPDPGPWQGRLVQVADDEQTNIGDHIFQASREELIRRVIPPAWETQRIYLREIGSSYQTKARIREAISAGALILEYAGHGGRTIWADENIFHIADVPQTQNGTRQPLVIATTCEMNFFDKPEELGQRPLGELFILGRNRGSDRNSGRFALDLCAL